MKAREFTRRGIARARQFLDDVRKNPTGPKGPPQELLRGPEYTRAFRGDLRVDLRWHAFSTRREIGEYLAPRLAPARARIADRTSFWSWLGVFHFEDTVRIVDGAARMSPLDEAFVIDPQDKQNLRGMHRHCLRAAWQLYEVHGEDAAFLLDQHPTARGDIADRVLQSQRVFNSAGVVPLILGLYTEDNRVRRGFQSRPGGLRHLLRVLDQLERTYDVYGMTPEALIRILPPEFTPWVNGESPSNPVGSVVPDQKLHQWEVKVRQDGRGTMRYKGFRAKVRIDQDTGALQGRIVNPAAQLVGTVSAADAEEWVRAMRSCVNKYLG